MSKTDKILQTMGEEPITLNKISQLTEMQQSVISGILISLLRQKRIQREKIERISGAGPKLQWAYKLVAQNAENVVDSVSE